MRRRAEATSAERQATGRGFHLIEILVCSAILALLISFMMPAYLNARNNAAVDEASAMAQEWRTLAYGCHLAHPNDPTACLSNTEIGFNEVRREVLELDARAGHLQADRGPRATRAARTARSWCRGRRPTPAS